MSNIKCGPTITSKAITHHGEWNEESRAIPAINFFEKYDAVVTAGDLSGSYHDWFAPSARFYANTGVTLHSGAEIWDFMKSLSLFGAYEIITTNRITTVIIGGHERGDRLIHQSDTVFYPKEGKDKGIGIPIRRTIEFVSGPSEVHGQGTDGLQYFVGKTFWDTHVLKAQVNQVI
ncbi:uncharacterized protein LY89DRAFT_672103 [Mollisia scopiformis]|uniref:Uncharacterized protein n=1 Tax=Mollisia scopiformis TaxID=149040 RepID=A0A194X1V4_MOLSC|nr:uncharacterized protein LY89DRAFT_672103 [Mollisia scopiformis]KUJ13822.1 hypothetical protein LY89DRAFT_672103 [Mollisia scopiformis]